MCLSLVSSLKSRGLGKINSVTQRVADKRGPLKGELVSKKCWQFIIQAQRASLLLPVSLRRGNLKDTGPQRSSDTEPTVLRLSYEAWLQILSVHSPGL